MFLLGGLPNVLAQLVANPNLDFSTGLTAADQAIRSMNHCYAKRALALVCTASEETSSLVTYCEQMADVYQMLLKLSVWGWEAVLTITTQPDGDKTLAFASIVSFETFVASTKSIVCAASCVKKSEAALSRVSGLYSLMQESTNWHQLYRKACDSPPTEQI